MRAENQPEKSKIQGTVRCNKQPGANKLSSPHLADPGKGVWGEGRLCSGSHGQSAFQGSCDGILRTGACCSELNESWDKPGGWEVEVVAEGRDWWAWDQGWK